MVRYFSVGGKILFFILLLSLWGIRSDKVLAADSLVIKAGEVSAFSGTSVQVPIVLSSEGGIAGVQFDVSFDAQNIVFQGIEGGDLGNTFLVMSNPLEENLQRILVYSMTDTSISKGSKTLCNLSFQVSPNAIPDSVNNIDFKNLVVPNTAGQDISSSVMVKGGKITVLKDPDAPTIAVSEVVLDQAELTLTAHGDPANLIAVVSPLNATDKRVEWSSSNPEVATVKDGLVTPIKPGKTEILATTIDGLKKAKCLATVIADSSFKLMVHDGRGVPGDTIKIPIELVSSGCLSAVQLDLGFNQDLLSINEVWKSSSLIGFSVESNQIGGYQRIIIYSSSGAKIPSGNKKIIELLFYVNSGASFGMESPLSLNGVIMSDTLGNNVTGEALLMGGSFLTMGCKEDFDCNGVVDIRDLVMLAKGYGLKNGQTQYKDYLDLNSDLSIDVYDLVILAKRYVRESE